MKRVAIALVATLAVACSAQIGSIEVDAGARDADGLDATLDASRDGGIDAPIDALTPHREGPCDDDAECSSGVCRNGECAMPCRVASDCPTTRGWACTPGTSGGGGCTCEPSRSDDPCADDVDSDCNGALECLVCDGHEVRLDDEANCGACGRTCPSSASCIGGGCACDDSARVLCGGECVDPAADLAHCGGCGRACPAGATCEAGTCSCPALSDAICGGTCVDLDASVAHCGACDAPCAEGERCDAGACACPVRGQRSCAGAGCVDPSSDPLHCGECGTQCAMGAVCVTGSCACAADRQVVCGAACVDLESDRVHCGACGRACPAGIDCVGGTCACPGATTACGTSCVDTRTNTAHCGGCGQACAGPCVAAGCIEPRSIGVGSHFTCVLVRDGRVLCWGAGANGKLGDGTEVLSRAHPEAVFDVDDATFLSVGAESACVLRPGGELWCWGAHGGSTVRSNRPVRIDDLGRPILHVSVGISRTCVVTDDGAAHCWGLLPGRFTVPGGFVQIATGESHTCGLTAARAVYCWGWNTQGQLGQGTHGVGMFFPDPVLVSAMPATGVEIDAGRDHTCVRTSSRDIWCWGADWVDQASAGAPVGRNVTSPRSIGTTTTAWRGVWTDMDAGPWDTSCGVMGSGTLLTFGDVDLVGTPPSDAVACAVGQSHGCVIRRGSVVSCWGTNVLGELGGGTAAYESGPPVDVRW